ncbi:BatD family protein [Salisaeta longa]|uniref:BatD family protein n=1 Tax=Salisaeta longa TaxID=503170 RepID=UPI000407CAD9|nr:BatD family protein [Salisaeta longa]
MGMQHIGWGLLWGLWLALAPLSVRAQAVTVRAEARPTVASAAGTVQYTLRIETPPSQAIQTPQPPATTNAVLTQRTPSRRQEVSFNSGTMKRVVTFTWTYQPLRVGQLRFRPLTLSVNGQSYTTQPIRVRVVPSGQAPAWRAPRAQRPAPDPSSRLSTDDLFIQAALSDSTVYVGEQLTLTYWLYFRPDVRMRRSRMARAWSAPGFWQEPLDVDMLPRSLPTVFLRGRAYKRIMLKRAALFPLHPGALRIEPLQIRTEAYATGAYSGDPLLAPADPYETVALSSDAHTVTAIARPPGAPAAFSGAVGTFKLRVTPTVDSLVLGEAVQVRVTIAGRGNLPMIRAPRVEAPPTATVYAPEVTTDIVRDSTSLRGMKRFTFTVVPQEGGALRLPPVRFAYFDPARATYVVRTSDAVRLHVQPQANAFAEQSPARPLNDVTPLLHTVRGTARAPLHRQLWPYAALLLPLLGATGRWVYQRQQARGDGTPVQERASADALLNAARASRADDPARAAHQVEQALRVALQARTGQPTRGRTHDQLRTLMARHDMPDTQRQAVVELLAACERLSYAPQNGGSAEASAVLARAEALLATLSHRAPAD